MHIKHTVNDIYKKHTAAGSVHTYWYVLICTLLSVLFMYMKQEQWLPLVDFEGLYEVSDQGRIRTVPREYSDNSGFIKVSYIRKVPLRYLSLTPARCGYIMIGLSTHDKSKVKRMVHRLVANTFIPNPSNKKEVNHINGNKHDNRVENLEWCTPKENIQHSVKIGSHPTKLTKEKVLEIRRLYIRGYSGCNTSDLGKIYNISGATVSAIVNRKIWKHI